MVNMVKPLYRTHVGVIFYCSVEGDGCEYVEWQPIMTTMTGL